MEQPETPQEPASVPPAGEAPASADLSAPAPQPEAKVQELPDTRGALAIPDHFRLPFHGKMVSPTAVPSATQRRANLNYLGKRRRRRGFLLGLLAGQLLIIGLDLGGAFLLRSNPQITLKAPFGVASIVFLGMAAGAALMILVVALVTALQALRALFGKKSTGVVAAAGSGIKRVVLTTLALGVTIGVIIGTAWFMIPQADWKPTIGFAKDHGIQALDASKARLRSMLPSAPSSAR